MEWPVGMSATREDRTCPPSQNHWVSMGLPRGKTLGKDGGKGRRPVRVWEVAGRTELSHLAGTSTPFQPCTCGSQQARKSFQDVFCVLKKTIYQQKE